MPWSEHVIDGRPAEMFTPLNRQGTGAIIYLHGYAGERLSTKPEFTAIFERHGLPVVAPQGGHAWWLDFEHPSFQHERTAAEYVRKSVVGWMQETLDVAPPHIALLGISMGGQGALNMAYRHAREFPIVVAIAPAIDFHTIYGRGYGVEEMFPSAEAARQHTVTLNIHPLNWPKHQFFACDPLDQNWYIGCQRLASKLASSGVMHERDLDTSLGGHNWTYFTEMAEKGLTFIKNALARV